MCQAPRRTTADRHHVHVEIALRERGEGNELAVRRDPGVELLAREAGEARRAPARAGDEPQVVGIREDDRAAVEVRIAEQTGGLGRKSGGREKEEEEQPRDLSRIFPGAMGAL
jgi:hypothetical protein